MKDIKAPPPQIFPRPKHNAIFQENWVNKQCNREELIIPREHTEVRILNQDVGTHKGDVHALGKMSTNANTCAASYREFALFQLLFAGEPPQPLRLALEI